MRFLRSALVLVTPVLAFARCNPSDSTVNNPDAAPVNECPAPSGPVIEHKSTITADETWSADSVHRVTFGISIKKGATLTIAPCAIVKVGPAYAIVADGGNLVAEGTATGPIQFLADDPSQPWGFIQAFAPGTIKLAYATVSDAGGEATNSFGAIEARGDQLLPAQEILKVDHVTVKGSKNYGVSLRAGAAFTKDSAALTITGSAKSPIRVLPRLVSNIPTGSYTGNTDDRITIAPENYGDVNVEDVTMHDRGVPYRVGDPNTGTRFWIGPQHFTLTIEPGVKLQFGTAGLIATKENNGTTGVLVAKGTADTPIVFTRAAPAPAAGDWQGIEFSKVLDAANALDHVEVRYAGGPSGANSFHCETDGSFSKSEDAAVSIYVKPGAFITNSLFSDSKGAGINLAYSDDYVDLKATNTFNAIAGCSVTRPRAKTTGACTASPCP